MNLDVSEIVDKFKKLPPTVQKATIGATCAVGFLSLASFAAGRYFNHGWLAAYVKTNRRLDGHGAIVTGANSGVGYETALELVRRGCHVIVTCRSDEKAQKTIRRIHNDLKSSNETTSSNGPIDYLLLDLCSKKSIDLFLENFFKLKINVNILVNNAGAWINDARITEDGMDAQWQANYFGPFYITSKLLNHIKKSSQEKKYGRIINVSSMLHERGTIEAFNGFINDNTRGNLSFWQKYPTLNIYGVTKCAQIIHAKKLQEELDKESMGKNEKNYIIVSSIHPGWVNSGLTNASSRGLALRIFYSLWHPFAATFGMLTPKQGAQTTLHCILNDGKNVSPGGYHAHCQPTKTTPSAQDAIKTKTDELYHKSQQIWN